MTPRRPTFHHLALALACVCLAAPPAGAFRPFDGTDARVAERHLFELELSPVSYARMGEERSLVAPQVTFNFGMGSGLELALEGRSEMLMRADPGGSSPGLADAGISFKQVVRPGALQERKGPSIATEGSIALPTGGQVHAGFGGSLLVSQALSATRTMMHFTAELARTRERRAERSLGVIFEGPESWPVRPVGELTWERVGGDAAMRGYLAGIIWQTRQGLTMDAAVKGLDGAEHGLELRTGFTWHMQMHPGARP